VHFEDVNELWIESVNHHKLDPSFQSSNPKINPNQSPRSLLSNQNKSSTTVELSTVSNPIVGDSNRAASTESFYTGGTVDQFTRPSAWKPPSMPSTDADDDAVLRKHMKCIIM
jgi:hypothetical protein